MAMQSESKLLPALRLRPIKASDEEFLFRLYMSTRETEMTLVAWSEEQKLSFLRMQFKAQHDYYQQQFPEAAFGVVERDGQAVGRLYVDRRPNEIRIIDIALLPEYRQSGTGQALLQGLLDEAALAGKPVRIHVFQGNPALRLYHRLGFVHVGDTGLYQLMEWTKTIHK